MTYQQNLCAATDTYREALTSWETIATSKHVSAVVLNAAGTGYTVGDILTITHASAAVVGGVTLSCTLEVLTITGGGGTGPIGTVRINNGGAFAERVASAVVGAAAGSGYAVGDILEVQDGAGASLSKAKFEVATLSGSAVATVTLYEAGGSYTTTPTTNEAATLGIGPAAFAGDDVATLDLTMQAIIGTTAIAATGGTGSSGSFDLTLTATGWQSEWSTNWGSADSLTDEKEVILLGTVSEGDAPYVGFRTYRQDSGGQKRYAIACYGMLAFNPALAGIGTAGASQPGIGPLAWISSNNSGSHILIAEEVAEANLWGISISPKRFTGWIRGNIATEADSYHQFYVGLLNGFGPATTTPYPMAVCASSNVVNRRTSDFGATGLAEAFQNPSGGGPLYYLRKSDLVWTTIRNAVTPTSEQQTEIMWPRGVMAEASGNENLLVENDNYKMFNDGVIGSLVRANVTGKVYPTPGTTNIYTLLPLTMVSTGGSGTNGVDTTIVGELDGCFFTGGVDETGTVHTPEDILEQGTDRYIIIPCSTESLANRPYQFSCFRMD